MANNRLRLVRGDTPPVVVAITDEATGLPVDLVGAVPRLKFKRSQSADPVTIVTGSVLPGRERDDGSIDFGDPYGTPGRGGRVLFQFGEPLMGPSGPYEAEVEVTFANGVVQTAYDRIFATVREQF